MAAAGDGDNGGALAEGLARSSERVCKHMNEDHGESVLAYAHCYANLPGATAARMTAVLPRGFEIEVEDGGTTRTVVVPYPAPLESAGQVRKRAVEMHHEAFARLGFAYRVRSGYYVRALRMAVAHVKGGATWTAAGVAVAAAVAGLLVLRSRQ